MLPLLDATPVTPHMEHLGRWEDNMSESEGHMIPTVTRPGAPQMGVGLVCFLLVLLQQGLESRIIAKGINILLFA